MIFNKLCVWDGFEKKEILLSAENAYCDKEIEKTAMYK